MPPTWMQRRTRKASPSIRPTGSDPPSVEVGEPSELGRFSAAGGARAMGVGENELGTSIVSTMSVGVHASLGTKHGQENDLEIPHERPISNVLEVVFDTLFHLVDRVRFAAPAVHLGPTRDSGLDLVPEHVTVDFRPVDLVVSDCMWARSDDAHVSRQHLKELGQFVE